MADRTTPDCRRDLIDAYVTGLGSHVSTDGRKGENGNSKGCRIEPNRVRKGGQNSDFEAAPVWLKREGSTVKVIAPDGINNITACVRRIKSKGGRIGRPLKPPEPPKPMPWESAPISKRLQDILDAMEIPHIDAVRAASSSGRCTESAISAAMRRGKSFSFCAAFSNQMATRTRRSGQSCTPSPVASHQN
jgi:hypothetical protein